MVTTRSKTAAAAPNQAPDIVLQTSNQSLLAWSTGSRKTTESGSSRKPQTAPILNLPLDVLAIVFSRCHPLDVLQFSRTCHDLSAFFHSKASKSIWIASRKTVTFSFTEDEYKAVWSHEPKSGTFALPDCPSYLSEPAYVAFVYERTCSYCPEADWDPSSGIMATRACYTCRKGFVSHKHLESEWGDEADPRIYSILPKMLFELDAGKEPRPTEKIYHKPTCEAIFHRSYQYDIEVNFDVTKMKQFFHKAEEAMKEREAFMRAFKQFQDVEHRFYDIKKRRERKEEEERYIRNKAFAISRLEAAGKPTYSTDIEDCKSAARLIRDQCSDFDDDMFAKIKGDLIKCLKPVQEQRRYITAYYDPENIRIRSILDSFRLALPEIASLATRITLADFIELPTCKALASKADFIHGEQEAQQAIWTYNTNNVIENIKAWVISKENVLLALLEKARKSAIQAARPKRGYIYKLNLSRSYIRMPYTTFVCLRCGDTLPEIADVLVHDCFATYSYDGLPNTRRRLLNGGLTMNGDFDSPTKFEEGSLQINWEKAFVGKSIYDAIVQSGDDAPTTIEDMCAKNGKLRCLQCPKDSVERSGTTVALSYAHHGGIHYWHQTGIYHNTAKTHRKFRYIPLMEETEEDAADDAEPVGVVDDAAQADDNMEDQEDDEEHPN